MDRKNSGAERSKRCLARALFSLMRQTPFEKITVTDIAKQADYTRQTFYQHFETKEDALRYYLEDLFDREFQAYTMESDVHTGDDLLKQVCIRSMKLFWGSRRDIAEVIMRNHMGNLLVEALANDWTVLFASLRNTTDVSIPLDKYTEEEKQLIYRYISGGPLYMFYYWSQTGRQYDERKLHLLLYEMLRPLFIGPNG